VKFISYAIAIVLFVSGNLFNIMKTKTSKEKSTISDRNRKHTIPLLNEKAMMNVARGIIQKCSHTISTTR